jgi:hypothetical protein
MVSADFKGKPFQSLYLSCLRGLVRGCWGWNRNYVMAGLALILVVRQRGATATNYFTTFRSDGSLRRYSQRTLVRFSVAAQRSSKRGPLAKC